MRNNNFDIVRLLLAAIVVLVHCADLSLSGSLLIIRHDTMPLQSGVTFCANSGVSGLRADIDCRGKS